MSRFVIKYANGNYGCAFNNTRWNNGAVFKLGQSDLQAARVFSNKANAMSSAQWDEGATIVEVALGEKLS